jgi:ankyrin repeat protein
MYDQICLTMTESSSSTRHGRRNLWTDIAIELNQLILDYCDPLTQFLNHHGIFNASNPTSILQKDPELAKDVWKVVIEIGWHDDFQILPFEHIPSEDEGLYLIHDREFYQHLRSSVLKWRHSPHSNMTIHERISIIESLGHIPLRNNWYDLITETSLPQLINNVCEGYHWDLFQKLKEKGLIDPSSLDDMFNTVGVYGRLDLLTELMDEYQHQGNHHRPSPQLICMASCSRGRLDILEFLQSKQLLHHSNRNWELASRNGNLDILRFLHPLHINGGSNYAVDVAAEEGNLDVLQFLLENTSFEASSIGMNKASANGHLEVVKYLASEDLGGKQVPCTSRALAEAAKGGHLELVRYMHESLEISITNLANIYATENGHLEVVQYLFKKERYWYFTGGGGDAYLQGAATGGHLDVVKFLIEKTRARSLDLDVVLSKTVRKRQLGNRKPQQQQQQQQQKFHHHHHHHTHNDSLSQKHVDMIHHILHLPKFHVTCTSLSAEILASQGQLELLKTLQAKHGLKCTNRGFTLAATNGHIDVVRYLNEKNGGDDTSTTTPKTPPKTTEATKTTTTEATVESAAEDVGFDPMDGASVMGHLEIVKYLSERRPEGCSKRAFVGAASNGYLEVLKYLMERHPDVIFAGDGEGTDEFGYHEDFGGGGDDDDAEGAFFATATETDFQNAWEAMLSFAVLHGRLEVVEYLVEVIFFLNNNNNNDNEGRVVPGGSFSSISICSPRRCIIKAAGSGYLDVVRYLVGTFGCDVPMEDCFSYAFERNARDVAKYLLEVMKSKDGEGDDEDDDDDDGSGIGSSDVQGGRRRSDTDVKGKMHQFQALEHFLKECMS